MRLLSAADIRRAMPMVDWMKGLAPAFTALSEGRAEVMERQALPTDTGTALFMGAADPAIGIVSKQVSVVPGNGARGLPGTLGSVLLSDAETGRPEALFDGASFTAWRTAAATGVATDLLARPEARQAALIGCGAQAETQLLALDACRPLEALHVIGHRPGQAEAFIEAATERFGDVLRAPLHAADLDGWLIGSMDIVVTATNSTTPLFPVDWLNIGVHVSAIGSFRLGMCEIDPALAGVATVFVESRHAALHEAGELIAAMGDGLSRPEAWHEIGEVMSGERPGRERAGQVTFYKSVGHSIFDLFAARALLTHANEMELGTVWDPETVRPAVGSPAA